MSLHVERRGAGSPLVLLHGIGHHWQAWKPVLERLATQHTVYAVDLPGFGSSPPLDGDLADGMPAMVAALREAFVEWGIDRPHVAGNSLGGALALELAACDAAASATVFSPAGFGRPWEARLALANLRSLRLTTRLPEPFMRRFLATRAGRVAGYSMLLGHPTRIPPGQALVDALALRRGTGFDRVARHARRYAFTGSVAVPVTVAWGTRDRILLPRQARRARELLAQGQHVSLRRAGHVPMFDEPELVAELILATAARA